MNKFDVAFEGYIQLYCIALLIYVTISVKTHIVRTSIHIERTKFNKITHATGAGLMGPAISEGSFKSTKTINHLTCLAMESSKIFVSFPWPER